MCFRARELSLDRVPLLCRLLIRLFTPLDRVEEVDIRDDWRQALVQLAVFTRLQLAYDRNMKRELETMAGGGPTTHR